MKQQTSTVAGASWLEHSILEHVKQALRVTLDWNAPAVSVPRKLSSVKFTLKSFRRHLERLMEIEEEGGYMTDVTEDHPHLATRIEQLAGDHDMFRRRIRQVVPMVEDLAEWQEAEFFQACEEIRELLDEVDRHDREEVQLLQEALLCDEGGEG